MSTSSMPPHAATARFVAPSARASVSPLPLIIGATSVVVSIAIAAFVATALSAPMSMLGVSIPLVRSGDAWWSILGYLLTPVVVIACYGWDTIAQRSGLRANRNIVLHPEWTRILLVLSGVGILLGAWHILNISVPLSEWLGLV